MRLSRCRSALKSMCRRFALSGYGIYCSRLAMPVLVSLLAAGSTLAQTAVDDSLREFEERVQAAFAAAETALASQEAQLHDLAIRHSREALADGRASVAQAAANVLLWEQRIEELRGVEGELRRELNNVLAELASIIGESVKRSAGGVERDEPVELSPESRDPSAAVRATESSRGTAGGEASAGTPRDDPAAAELSLGLDRSIRAVVQMGLTSLGFDAGPADGLFGNRTRSAVRTWQTANDHQATGYLTRVQADALIAAGRVAQQELAAVQKQAAERKRREQRRVAQQREERQRQQEIAETKQAEAEKGQLGSASVEVFRDCPECPEMVVVPPGSFRMGGPYGETGRQNNEGPQHRVEIRRPFAVSMFEVTRLQFLRFAIDTNRTWANTCITFERGEIEERMDRHWQSPGFHQTDRHPIVCVSWDDALAYVGWLSLRTGKPYRLLSESEWEYVARAGTSTARYWGDSESDQCRHANGLDASTDLVGRSGRAGCHDGYPATSPAGAFTRNPFGVYDVLGNVWEWTQDCALESYGEVSGDGRARQTAGCDTRVVRGGSWINGPTFLRSARRDWLPADHRFNVVGFRIARTLDAPR
ncbi:MAG: SUMF1/EgtB/PvdO family nonheme iron enzyme [Candidatus Tectomicrobia bacterium]|nr:SUMF1/EgtB/PvdO family nonheme iron enzyme [Candidatus Tectomicrobia bacterium]